MNPDETHKAIEAVWRIESTRVLAVLARYVRDLDLAEDLAHEALVVALEQWPVKGIPPQPRAWLITTAKRRAIDQFRRKEIYTRALSELALRAGEDAYQPDFDANLADHVEDDVLRLIFVTCHPVLSATARVALALRLLGGLSTAEIAKAYLTTESAISQRMVRAKRTLAHNDVPFEVPTLDELPPRLSSVLEVIYLIFNEGYSASFGDEWTRPALAQEALRLGRILASHMANNSEIFGLLSLMELQASRFAARVGPGGEPVLLKDQDRARWDQLLIRRGLASLDRAENLAQQPDAYLLQARIAACHARARDFASTDWGRIVAHYKSLAALSPSPIVELNMAVAISMSEGPDAALSILEALDRDETLRDYHLLPSARADILQRLGRWAEAEAELRKAASLTDNLVERALLMARAGQLRGQT